MSILSVTSSSALAAKQFSVAVFAGVQSAPGFLKLMSGPAPQLGDAMSKLTKLQTSPGYPVVKLYDLAANPGSQCSVDLVNILQGKPTMGDKRLDGRGLSASSSSMDVSINRSRFMADTGGKMAQKRTRHDLRNVVKGLLQNIGVRLEDQRTLVHLAGARGDVWTPDWVIPLQSDPEFNEILVNPIKAPTYNRRFFASASATSVANLTISDILTIGDVARIAAQLRESTVPLQNVEIEEDANKWQSPLWVMWVTQRQWYYMRWAAGSLWQGLVQAAVKRFDGSKQHPLFQGDSVLIEGILVRPLDRYAIRFAPGSPVTAATSATAYTETTETVPSTTNFYVDRAVIVGAQALIKAYGNEGNVDFFYRWVEEWVDKQSVLEVALSMMEGTAKTRFAINGIDTDHGVATIDSYAPPQNSAEGQTALALTKK